MIAIKIGKLLRGITIAAAIVLSVFQLYTGGVRLLPGLQQRAIHLGLALLLIFAIYPWRKNSNQEEQSKRSILDLIFSIGSIIIGLYLFSQFEAMSLRIGSSNVIDLVIGAALILLTLEASRRLLGWSMVVVALFFLGYAFFGEHLPLVVAHTGYSVERIISQIALGTEGILGVALGVSASQVAIFIIFGAFLEQSGAGQFFIDLALAGFGRLRGGPAKAAIGASSLFGMISGSQVANVASVGVFTIPLMKRMGYKPEFAGAVEAAASTGGMFLPPVMGATAFLIAEVLQLKYVDVAIAAAVPAILYYLALFVMVDLRSARLGLHGMKKEELPNLKQLLKERGYQAIPLLVLIVFMFFLKASPAMAAFWSIVSTPLAALLGKDTRMGFKSIVKALQKGAELTLIVAIACATAGIIIGVINLTGLGLRFSSLLVSVADGNLPLLLILTMISSLILGMGLPPVAAYIVLAVLAAPAIINVGVDPMAAHLFIFFFGIIGAVTPPVAMAAYAAAGIAKADPTRTGIIAFRLAMVAFIIPFQFVFGPALILKGEIFTVITSVISAIIGVLALAIALEGYLKKPIRLFSRVLMGIAALCLMKVGLINNIVGLIIMAAVMFYERHSLNHRSTSQSDKLQENISL